jgi:magnesium chelatase subunit D
MSFGSIVGMRQAKEALLMLAVEPGLQGVLVSAGPGAGKSSLARAFGTLVGHFVEIPAGVTEDRLLGGIDLERTLRSGKPVLRAGLLSRAGGGVAYVDNADLLDARMAQQIAQALSRGTVTLEREGFSATLAAKLALVASYSPGAAAVSAMLKEALGLHVIEEGPPGYEERVAVLMGNVRLPDDAALQEMIEQARALLPNVHMASEDERRLLTAAAALGVQGHRADAFAIKAARARAALNGRALVQQEDVQTALRLVLYPRAAATAPEAEQIPPEGAMDSAQPSEGELQTVPAAAASAPEGVFQVAERMTPRPNTRGRYVRPVQRVPAGAKIAWEATLRRAAPFQQIRRTAAGRIQLRADDLRFKQFRQDAGILAVFAVDASGSMATHRMHHVKGAAIDLLQRAYLRGAKVAVVTFRGSQAEVALRPTRSVALARRALEAMPAGGGTPLAAGLEAVVRMVQQQNGPGMPVLLVLLTDGRANVARNAAGVWQDVERVCAVVRASGITSIVIDTGNPLVTGGEAENIARWLGGRRLYLPRADAAGISGAVNEEIRRLRDL